MNGSYLASQVIRLAGPIIAFREYVFRDVLPAFGNIDERANQVSDEYYNRALAQPAGEYEDIDMADIAEVAQDRSLGWYEMMTSLRQTMLNLMTAGLFHLVEQQLAALGRDGIFRNDPPGDTKLEVVTKWYLKHFGFDLKALASWSVVDELRLVANTVKHAEGHSAEQLRKARPALFSDPRYIEMFKEYEIGSLDPAINPVSAPLSGEDLFVTESLLQGYAENAERFFLEISEYFHAHP